MTDQGAMGWLDRKSQELSEGVPAWQLAGECDEDDEDREHEDWDETADWEDEDCEDDPEELSAVEETSPPDLGRALKRILCLVAGSAAVLGTVPWMPGDLAKTVTVLVVLFALVPAILTAWLDVARAMHAADGATGWFRVARVLASLPQACLGIVAMAFGLAMIAWVLYNSFVERLPQYSGGFLTMGISTSLLCVGWYWLRGAFRRDRPERLTLPRI